MSSTGHIGIDYGTTKTTLAYAERGGGKAIILASFPTVVLFPGEEDGDYSEPVIGNEALSESPMRVWQAFKLEMGKNSAPFSCRQERLNSNCAPSPQHLASVIFRKLRNILCEEINASTNKDLGPLTISVPAESTFRQRQAVIFSAVVAGFKEISIVEEPIAAFLMHYYARPNIFKDSRYVLVIDFGGGTCDLAIIKKSNNRIPLVVGTRTVKIGGNDIDEAIIAFWKRKNLLPDVIQNENGQYSKQIVQGLLNFSRLSKHSSNPIPSNSEINKLLIQPLQSQVPANLSEDMFMYLINNEKILPPPLNPGNYLEIMSEILQKVERELNVLLRCIEDKSEIDQVILAGGSSYIRQIINFVRVQFPHLVKDSQGIEKRILFKEPENAIALGALEYQRNLSNGHRAIDPVLPMSTYLELDYDYIHDISGLRKIYTNFDSLKIITHNRKSYIELAKRGSLLKNNNSVVGKMKKLLTRENSPILNPLFGARLLHIPVCPGRSEIQWRVFQVRWEPEPGCETKDYESIDEDTEPVDEIKFHFNPIESFISGVNVISFTYAFDIYGDFYRLARLFSDVLSKESAYHDKFPDFDWRKDKIVKNARNEFFGDQENL